MLNFPCIWVYTIFSTIFVLCTLDKGFMTASSQILNILIDISSQPCALWLSRALMIFSISLSENLVEFSLISVSKLNVPGKKLLFLMGVHLSAKRLLKN